MANYYGINKGDNEYAAASSTSSSTGKDVEIVVNTTNVTDRQTLINSLEKLTNFLIRSKWPL